MEQKSKRLARELKQVKAKLVDMANRKDVRRHAMLAEQVKPLEQQIAQLKREIEAKIALEFPYGDFDTVRSQAKVLEQQLNDAKVAEAVAAHNGLVGTTMIYWKRPRYGNGPMTQTSTMAVIAVYDGTNAGANTASWRLPEIGGLFLRNIRKDGTAGGSSHGFIRDEQVPQGWYPVGVNPNEIPNE